MPVEGGAGGAVARCGEAVGPHTDTTIVRL